jgi:uncharacterized protein (TIGR02453 family)
MIEKTTLSFLTKLKKNNTKEWFDANRKDYEVVKENIKQLVEKLIVELGKYDADVAQLQVKDCLFRINRDIRFSKNKAPYKTNIGCALSKGGKKASTAEFYVHIEPGKCFVGCGFWGPEAPKLQSLRQEVDYNLKEWEAIVKNKKFITAFPNGFLQDDALQRPPKGYTADNPALPYLKLKHFVVTAPIKDEIVLSNNYVKELTKLFIVAKPFIDFLNTAD